MNACMICGESYDISSGLDYRGKRIWLCNTGSCTQEFERDEQRDEQDAYEYEIQEAHDEVDRRFGY